jgi:hypothetical protein
MLEVPPTPDHILTTLQGYRDAAALNTALDLDLFSRIAHGADTPDKIAGELDIPGLGVRLICECLASTGLLVMDGGQVKLPPDSAAFLDKESPQYLGAELRALYSPALLRSYEQLTASVRAGVAKGSPATRPGWFDMARGIYSPEAATGAFADSFELPPGRIKVLELGSRNGAFGIEIARRNPDAIVVSLDSPEVLAKAQEKAEAAKLGTRYQNIPGDPLVVEFGRDYDAVIVPGALYQFDESQISSLFMKLHYALKKTGRLAILEFLNDHSDEFSRKHAGFRLNLLAATPRGDAYSVKQLEEFLDQAGFHHVETRPIAQAAATILTATP